MKKKEILFVMLGVLCLACTYLPSVEGMMDIIDIIDMAKDTKIKSVNETELRNYAEEKFAEKYGKKFEVLDVYSYNFMFSRDYNIKCVDDGVEFQANIAIKDGFEITRENYLLYKYFDDAQNEINNYIGCYFENYKLVANDKSERITDELPFDTPADLSYEELKERKNLSYTVYILIPEDTNFSDEEWSAIEEKFADSEEKNTYKEDMNLRVHFAVFSVPSEMYHQLELMTSFDEFRRLQNNKENNMQLLIS